MKMNKLIVGVVACIILATACNPGKETSKNELLEGYWQAHLTNDDGKQIPFMFSVNTGENGNVITLHNAEDKIAIDQIVIHQDSIEIPMHIFDSQISAKIEKNHLAGFWVKNEVKDYRVPFEANYIGKEIKNPESSSIAPTRFTGKWEVEFKNNEGQTRKAIALIDKYKDGVKGSFITATGDYRFLEGNISGDTIRLSNFDGAFAMLFEAVLEKDGTLNGTRWSGKSFSESWSGIRNDTFELPDPHHLTELKEGEETLEFALSDKDGKLVTLQDKMFEGKVVIVQILGSWCANCMDETKFLSEWYNSVADKDKVVIVGLAFEKKEDPEYIKGRIAKLVARFNIQYPMLIGGKASKEVILEKLPTLADFKSYPTTFFVDKNGKVRRIHTGFSGPGTGVYYEQFVEEFERFTRTLIAE